MTRTLHINPNPVPFDFEQHHSMDAFERAPYASAEGKLVSELTEERRAFIGSSAPARL